MRVYLIDDELPAREYLRSLLLEFEGIEVVGISECPLEALPELKSLKPDLLFLDIQMPRLSGIDFSKILTELSAPPLIVFSTAYSQFAVDAFDVDAIDYLLKPFDKDRLSQTLDRAARQIETLRNHTANTDDGGAEIAADDNAGLIVAHKNEKMILLSPDEVVFAKCEDSITFVYTRDSSYRTTFTISSLYEQLKKHRFFQSHRNTLVNLSCVREIHPWFNGCSKLIMNNLQKSEVLVSRRKNRELKKFLAYR